MDIPASLRSVESASGGFHASKASMDLRAEGIPSGKSAKIWEQKRLVESAKEAAPY
jgi:hypothetical protein